MTPLIIALLVSVAPQGAAAKKPTPDRACAFTGATLAAAKPGRGVHPLGQEPRASEYLTVVRKIDGCDAPVIVRTKFDR